jgi:hypothetical protein
MLAPLCFISDAFAIGSSGWFATRVKVEYQYTDYSSYRYPKPIPPTYPDVIYRQLEPYIADFPEKRALFRITQMFGPITSLQLRYQVSELTEQKDQKLYYLRLARDVTPMNNIYGIYQYIDQPDWLDGYMLAAGWRYNRAGWILAEGSFSYLRNHSHTRNLDGTPASGPVSAVETYAPLLSLRYSVNSTTALYLKWESFWVKGEYGEAVSHAYTAYLSRFFPTQTAMHIFGRWFTNDDGTRSFSPGLEVAQYILWNLTVRLGYRHYRNSFDDPVASLGLESGGIRSNSISIFAEYQIITDLKLHLKLRRYESNQHIKMNTYLLGLEYLI